MTLVAHPISRPNNINVWPINFITQKIKEVSMSQTVIGFFDDASEAQRAVEKLQSSGISRDRIDVSRGSGGESESSDDTKTINTVSNSTRDHNTVRTTSDGRTVDEGGRNTNKFTDFFNSLFGGGDDDKDNDDAGRYSHVAQRSNSIVTVHAQSGDEAERAADILDDCGAVNVDERAEQYGYANAGNRERSDMREDLSSEITNNETSIPRVQENLEVGKRMEERGSVRLRSRIVERPVEEHVRLREEHVNIERQQVNRPVSGDRGDLFQEKDIELTEKSEVPVVNKEARVVEEIRLNKEVNERDETIRDTVRDTEIDIENTGSGTGNRATGTDNDLDLDDDATRRGNNL
jgi:stress response protein YsnF